MDGKIAGAAIFKISILRPSAPVALREDISFITLLTTWGVIFGICWAFIWVCNDGLAMCLISGIIEPIILSNWEGCSTKTRIKKFSNIIICYCFCSDLKSITRRFFFFLCVRFFIWYKIFLAFDLFTVIVVLNKIF